MTCNTISLVSRLTWKRFRWKFTDILEDVCSLHTCFSADSFHLLCCITPCESSGRFSGHPVYAVVSRANLRGPSNQRVMWLRTCLFNHYNISFLAIFHLASNSQILDFICLPFASDHCLYAFTPKRIFIIFNFNFWFNFQGVFVSSLREYCSILYLPCQRAKFAV